MTMQDSPKDVRSAKTNKVILRALAVAGGLSVISTGLVVWQVTRPEPAAPANPLLEPPPPVVLAPEAEQPARPPKPDRIVGIGLILARDQKTRQYVVTRVFPASPAAKAGLPTGVLLTKIDNVRIQRLQINDVTLLIRGPAGSKVNLETVDPNTDQTNRLEIIREEFDNNSR